MGASPTLDFSKAQPLQSPAPGGVHLDFSKAQPIGQKKTDQPGFLDREIPLTSYGNATLSGVQSIGRGVHSALQGVGRMVAHPIDTTKETLNSFKELPSEIAQVPGAIHDINQSPDPFGTYMKAAQETAGQGAGQALLALGTEGLTRGIGAVSRPVAGRLYQSALKPSTTLGRARIARMVDTGLESKIPIDAEGAERLSGKIGDINDRIDSTISANPGRTVNKFAVASRLGDTAKKFSQQVNPEADLNAIGESGNEFLRTQPGRIPGPSAQALKRGTYRTLGDRSYGELGSATTEAQKALARGLKEELVKAYPELAKLNAQDSRLIDLQDALERAVIRHGNRTPLGLGGPAVGAATKIATGSSPLGIGAAYLKAALSDPAVSSRLAIALNRTGRLIARPGVGASAGVIAGASRLGDRPTSAPAQ